jgi:hypothetical protein
MLLSGKSVPSRQSAGTGTCLHASCPFWVLLTPCVCLHSVHVCLPAHKCVQQSPTFCFQRKASLYQNMYQQPSGRHHQPWANTSSHTLPQQLQPQGGQAPSQGLPGGWLQHPSNVSGFCITLGDACMQARYRYKRASRGTCYPASYPCTSPCQSFD